MGQILHKRATTTQEVRRAIQNSQESLSLLAKRYHLNVKTVKKWHERDYLNDAPMGPKRSTSIKLNDLEEAIVCGFRQKTLLPLDDCFLALKDQIPSLTRSNLYRCLKRNGLNQLPKEIPEIKGKGKFKSYPLGYIHIDICKVTSQEKQVYLFVAIERLSKFIYAEVHETIGHTQSVTFLKNLVLAVPFKIHTILTDNGIQFSYRLFNERNRPKNKIHPFLQVCQTYNIKHRLTKFRLPWTNGLVERANRTLKEATVKTYFYTTVVQLKNHLYDFICAYNHGKRLKALQWKTPMQKILDEYTYSPQYFHTNPHHYLLELNS